MTAMWMGGAKEGTTKVCSTPDLDYRVLLLSWGQQSTYYNIYTDAENCLTHFQAYSMSKRREENYIDREIAGCETFPNFGRTVINILDYKVQL